MEVENRRSTIPKKENKVKVLNSIPGNTLREVLKEANLRNIEKDDIVSILRDNGQFWLIYYK